MNLIFCLFLLWFVICVAYVGVKLTPAKQMYNTSLEFFVTYHYILFQKLTFSVTLSEWMVRAIQRLSRKYRPYILVM